MAFGRIRAKVGWSNTIRRAGLSLSDPEGIGPAVTGFRACAGLGVLAFGAAAARHFQRDPCVAFKIGAEQVLNFRPHQGVRILWLKPVTGLGRGEWAAKHRIRDYLEHHFSPWLLLVCLRRQQEGAKKPLGAFLGLKWGCVPYKSMGVARAEKCCAKADALHACKVI